MRARHNASIRALSARTREERWLDVVETLPAGIDLEFVRRGLDRVVCDPLTSVQYERLWRRREKLFGDLIEDAGPEHAEFALLIEPARAYAAKQAEHHYRLKRESRRTRMQFAILDLWSERAGIAEGSRAAGYLIAAWEYCTGEKDLSGETAKVAIRRWRKSRATLLIPTSELRVDATVLKARVEKLQK